MAKQPETLFKEKVLTQLKELPGCWADKIQQVVIRGTPDILCCINGFYVGLELKAHKNAPVADIQKYVLQRINDAGGYGFTVYPDNWEAVYEFLKSLAEREKS